MSKKALLAITVRLHERDLEALHAEVHDQIKPLLDALDEATELLADAMIQGCHAVEGWLNTGAISTYRDIGDWLVQHAGWERDPGGHGRQQWYRAPREQAGAP